MHTKDKLADALQAIGLTEMSRKARTGYYHDFLSPLDLPEMALVTGLGAAATQHPDKAEAIEALRNRVIDGEFDASAEESDAWAASEEGQEAMRGLIMEAMREPPDEDMVRANAARIHEAGRAARERNVLSLWTVYDHPKDYPDGFIARRFEAGGGGGDNPVVTADVVTGDLETIRESMVMCGLHRLARAPADDARIVETWL